MKWFLKCMKDYINFRGRASRAEFWYFILVLIALTLLAAVADYTIRKAVPDSPRYALTVVKCFLFLPLAAVQMRRMHDVGRSGWWIGGWYSVGILTAVFEYLARVEDGQPVSALANFSLSANLILVIVSAAYGLFLLYCFCRKSDAEANKYGARPIVE